MPMLAALLCAALLPLGQSEAAPTARLQVQTGALTYGRGAVSPNGQVFAVGTGTNREASPLTLWEVNTGRQILTCAPPPSMIVGDPIFSTDSRRVSSLTQSGLVTWDVYTGRELDFREGASQALRDKDGVLFVTEQQASLLDLSTLDSTPLLTVPADQAVFPLDRTHILTSDAEGRAALYIDGKPSAHFKFKRTPNGAFLAGDATVLVNCMKTERNVQDNVWHVLDLKANPPKTYEFIADQMVGLENAVFGRVGKEGFYAAQSDWSKVVKTVFPTNVTAIAARSDRRQVLAADDAGTYLFDPSTGRTGSHRPDPETAPSSSTSGIYFVPKSSLAILVPHPFFDEGQPVVLDVDHLKLRASFDALAMQPAEVGLSAAGARLVVDFLDAPGEGGSSTWDLETGQWAPPAVPGAAAITDSFPESFPNYLSFFMDGRLFDYHLLQNSTTEAFQSDAAKGMWAQGFYGLFLVTQAEESKAEDDEGLVKGTLRIFPRLDPKAEPIDLPYRYFADVTHGPGSDRFWLVTEDRVSLLSGKDLEETEFPPLPVHLLERIISDDSTVPTSLSLQLSASEGDRRLLAVSSGQFFRFKSLDRFTSLEAGVAAVLDAGTKKWSLIDLGRSEEVTSGSISRDGRHAYLATLSGKFLKCSTETLKVEQEIRLGGSGRSIVLDEKRGFAFVATPSHVAVIDLQEGREAAKLISRRSGSWAVVTPEGRFDTSNPAQPQGLFWVFADRPFRPFPVELLMRDYYEPRLLSRILAREKFAELKPVADVSRALPEISIASISEPNEEGQVSVRIKVDGSASAASDLHLLRDGVLVARLRTPLCSRGESKEFTFDKVNLPRSGVKEARFEAYAFNPDRAKSETASQVVAVDLEPLPRRAFVLGVGVNSYDDPSWNLQFAAADAEMSTEILEHSLKASKKFDEVLAGALVSDGENKEATKEALAEGFAELAEEFGPQDTLVIHWAGHGYAAPDGQFYFIPSDIGANFTVSDPEKLKKAISSDELSDWLLPLDCGQIILIVDACHSEATVAAEGFKPGPMGARGLGQLAYDKGMIVVAATQTANVALESGDLGHGLLSFSMAMALLDNKEQPGEMFLSNGRDQKSATFGDLFQYMKMAVPYLHQLLSEGKLVLARTGRVTYVKDKRAGVQQPQVFDFTRGQPPLVLGR